VQTQTQLKYEDLCRVTLEVASPKEIIEALKWIKNVELKELDFDSAIKVEYIKLSRCDDFACYNTFDDFDIERVYGVEVVKFINRDEIDKRTYRVKLIVIPKKFADAFIELRHENEYGVHYHSIYRTSVVDSNAVNGWIERIVYRKDP
jgi:hypothetical protein